VRQTHGHAGTRKDRHAVPGLFNDTNGFKPKKASGTQRQPQIFFSSFKNGNLYVFASLKGFLKKYLIDSMVYDKKAGTKVLSLAVPEMFLAVFGKGNASLPLFPIK
jgi:hypothetical protein